ncbi:hypothetical protein THRCLA_08660 [Thraustotheca clavata]|uniref:Transmembrane protein n=1 Tax=Thraustotheca clavata TaxID=74557 RepID=A0A1V9Z3N0_9STRA|nr:hypothetical protein THRCLA_08660 [Thraustotheca clavata]
MDEEVSLLEEQPYIEFNGDDKAVRRRSLLDKSLGRRKSLLQTPFLCADEADYLILRANDPPETETTTLQETLKLVKARKYRLQQFAKMQSITGMNPMTLRFKIEYEAGFHDKIQNLAPHNTQYCFLLGFTGSLLYYTWEASRNHLTPFAYALAFGLGVGSFFIGFLLAFCSCMIERMELLSIIVFSNAALSFILFKPAAHLTGPILPLFILIIPIFGVTRVRFLYSCILGWSIFFLYITIQLIALQVLDFTTEKDSDILYQGLNYGMMVLGGMVSHYRQELLRRRNYALQLPFTTSNNTASETSDDLEKPKFSKSRLLYPFTLEFRNEEVETCFMRHWYLVDPFPFENPNAAVLHQGAFKVVRFSIATAVFNQCFLAIQDYRLLKDSPSIQKLDYGLRFGAIATMYISSAALMFVLGKQYFRKWIDGNLGVSKEVEQLQGARTPSRRQALLAKFLPTHFARQALKKAQHSDVVASQYFSACVVLVHTSCMAIMLFSVASSRSARSSDVYFMGFINSILFSHRSGFRVRHRYAVLTTTLVGFSVILVAIKMLHVNGYPYLWIRYGAYIIIVLVLAGMISREEESLRRDFFILKSIRTLEFEEWYQTIINIQGKISYFSFQLIIAIEWVRTRLINKVKARREAKKSHSREAPVLIDTSTHLSQASKIGMYGEFVHLLLVVIDLLVHISS